MNIIKSRKINRDNYLFLGLFCEGVMSYSIWDYFAQERFVKDKQLSALHFKNKDSGGWPGNIKLFFEDGTYRF